MQKFNICVVGVGAWGSNHVRSLISMNHSVGCVDQNHEKLIEIKTLFPSIKHFSRIEDTFKEKFDGYIIATPPASHTELAKIVILNGKPLLIEKPLSLTLSEAKEIKAFLVKYGGKLMVGHLMLFHPAIIKIKSMIDEQKIGDIQYIYSNRLNLGTVRKEENVFWSFAPHDISIFQYFSNSFPCKVDSFGGDFLQKGIHDTTITYLKYPNGIQGHIYVSWLHPFKEHRLVVIGSKGSIHFEDSINSKPLQFYEKDNSETQNPIILKNKIAKIIEYDDLMPLNNELNYFIEMIKGNSDQRSDIDHVINVVKILETASSSLDLNRK